MNKHPYGPILAKILLSAVIFLLTLTTQAKVYKWTDENGKVHYSDKPIDKKSEQIKMQRQPTDAEVLRARQRASSLIQHQNKFQSIADEDARDKQLVDQKSENKRVETMKACKEAKRLIMTYSSGRRIFTMDENGKKIYKGYTDDEKNQMIAELQKSVKENCNNL